MKNSMLGDIMTAAIYLCLITALCLPSLSASMMTGGWTKRDPNDPEIQQLASFAVDSYNKQSNYINEFTLVCVVAAESQVVSGAKYMLKLKIGETDCRKNYSGSNAQPCDPQKSQINKVIICTFIIWQQLWLNHTEVLSYSCTP
ncbi:cystatin-1-like [Mantella aurantiaca]